ncbi:hypothetical protein Tco_1506461 [Tanacetum coccineum]
MEKRITALAEYKEKITIFEQRLNVDLNQREKLIDSQMDDLIRDRNAKLAAFQQEINTVDTKVGRSLIRSELDYQIGALEARIGSLGPIRHGPSKIVFSVGFHDPMNGLYVIMSPQSSMRLMVRAAVGKDTAGRTMELEAGANRKSRETDVLAPTPPSACAQVKLWIPPGQRNKHWLFRNADVAEVDSGLSTSTEEETPDASPTLATKEVTETPLPNIIGGVRQWSTCAASRLVGAAVSKAEAESSNLMHRNLAEENGTDFNQVREQERADAAENKRSCSLGPEK